MAFGNKSFFSKLNKANKIISEEKSASQLKATSIKEKYKSISNMQAFVDMSKEKRGLLLNVVQNVVDVETNKKLLEKGIVLFIKLLEVIKLVEEDFKGAGIEFKTITGKVSDVKRKKIVDWFNEDSANKILIISDAGGESINIKETNEIILYNIPDGYRKFMQTLGRVCRGKFEVSHVHLIQVESSIDMYLSELISSKKELENELLHCDNIPLKGTSSFNAEVLKRIKRDKLWKC